ncbi:MAG: glycerol dehydrogenase [Clostridiales bacterium]|jgi:glycerol dehydrogenase|nr:glycerol dehydrogenase [Clostridiales bacterium]
MRKAFISPSKFVQGEGELNNLGNYVKLFGSTALVIGHKDDIARVADKLKCTEKTYGVKLFYGNFNGECSREEIARLSDAAKAQDCECIIGLGGGKAIDTAKCVADSQKPVIIVPTIAATDAPTSSSAVLYHTDGSFDDYAYFKSNPNIVLVDTEVIAKAPVRFLVSGMGDALSTYFEARACAASSAKVNAGGQCGGAVGTKAAMALAELCYQTLLEDGYKAKLACESKVVTKALENIVEANILLSGLGFESGGLAAAHAIHDGFTVVEEAHKFYHGEKVAFGTIVQLVLENADSEEIDEVISFCKLVGLPTCLADFGIKSLSDEALKKVAEKSCIPEESVHNMPFKVTPDDVAAAILAADKLGGDL